MKSFFIAILTVLASFAGGEITAPADTLTNATFAAKRAEYDISLDTAAYKKANQTPHDWDADAMVYIADVARFRAFESAPDIDALERRGRLLFVNGCDDPLILSCYGRVLQAGLHRQLAAIPILEQACANMTKRGYSKRNLAMATRMLWKAWATQYYVEQTKDVGKRLVGVVAEMIAAGDYASADRAFLLEDVCEFTEGVDLETFKTFSNRISKIFTCDEVVKRVVEGRYHIQAGWEARGSGFAETVQPKGWEAFDQHMTAAAATLARAYELDPSLPQAASDMIYVSLGNGPQSDCRIWFDRAIKARFDYAAAYRYYAHSLTPQWGGSQADMYAFAVECADTARYDTDTPHKLFDILTKASIDPAKWNEWGAYPALKKMYEGYIASPTYKNRATTFASTFCAIAAHMNHFDDAREILDDIDEHLDTKSLANLQYTPETLREIVYAMTGPAKDQANQIVLAEKRRDWPAATKLCEQAAAIPQSASAIHYFKSRAQALRWKQDFEGGKPVALAANAELDGFSATGGKWHAESGGVVGRQDQFLSSLKCETEFGNDWELSADVDVLYPSDYSANAAISIYGQSGVLVYNIKLLTSTSSVSIAPEWRADKPIKSDVRTFNKVNVIMHEGKISVAINGKAVATDQPVEPWPGSAQFIAFSCKHLRPGDIVRFSNIVIKKTTAAP